MSERTDSPNNDKTSRRDFLKNSTAAVVAGSATLGFNSSLYAAGSDTLRVGLIGCGGRGTGAASQALKADPNTKLVAMGDAFPDHLQNSLNGLKKQFGDQVHVDKDHQFVGFEAYKHVIDSVDVVLLTTPPHFRPMQLKAAVEAGKHVFCEKPVAVDAPGVRSVIETCKLARKKNISLVSGLCWRYHPSIRATFEKMQSGAIGEIRAMQCSYNTGGLWMKPRKSDWSDMEWQLRNWLYFTWLSGDHIVEQHIHSLDKMTWAMGDAAPVSVSGTGGRQVRTGGEYGHIYDHFAIEYTYANGVKAFSRCRQQNGCKADVSDHFFGTKGTCDIASHRTSISGETDWRYRGANANMYQIEHDELFASIRSGKTIHNGDYMTTSTMLAIIGRMAAYTGQTITWDQAMKSTEDLSPERYDWISMEVPQVAMPGVTRFA